MDMISRQILLGILVFVWSLLPEIAVAVPDELVELQQTLTLKQAVLQQKVGPLDENYIAALKRLEDSEKNAGKLESVLAIRNEIEAHSENGGSDPENVQARLSEEAALRNLQNTYLGARAEIDAEIAEANIGLLKKYHETLSQLAIDLTKESRIEDAIAVREERDKIAAMIGAKADDAVAPEEDMSEAEPVRARAHLVAKAEAEFFLNGESVYMRQNDDYRQGIDAKSTFFEVKEGDVVVLRIRSNFVYRSVAFAVELPDDDRTLFFGPEDFKVVATGLSAKASDIDAATVEAAPENHPEKTLPDRPWVEAWEDHRLDGGGFLKPEPQGEWVLWGSVLTKEMLERQEE